MAFELHEFYRFWALGLEHAGFACPTLWVHTVACKTPDPLHDSTLWTLALVLRFCGSRLAHCREKISGLVLFYLTSYDSAWKVVLARIQPKPSALQR